MNGYKQSLQPEVSQAVAVGSVPRIRVERRSLPQELANTLREWLKGQVVGTRLPSERKLAQQLEVCVLTLRKALAELLATGEMVRVGKKTFVGKPAPSRGPEDMHPLFYAQMHPQQAVTVLNMAYFETLPLQKQCWTQLQDRFNATHGDVQLQLRELPHEIDTAIRYAHFIRQNKIDLALCGDVVFSYLRESGMLKPLPESIVRGVCSDKSLYPAMHRNASADEILFGVPLHCSFNLIAWNTTLTGAWNPPSTDAVDAAMAAQWLRAAAPYVTEGCAAMEDPAAVLLAAGYNFDAFAPEDIRRYIREAVDVAETLKKVPQCRFRFHDSHPGLSLRAFVEGRAAFAISSSFRMLAALGSLAFPWRAALAMPREPYQPWTAATRVGVTAEPDRVAEAGEAVRFFLTAEAQTLIAAGRLNCPMRKDSVGPLAKFLGLEPEVFLRQMSRSRFAERRQPTLWVWFVPHVVIPYVNGVLAAHNRADREAMVAHIEAECRARLSGPLPL